MNLTKVFAGLVVACSVLTACASLPDDGRDAKMTRFDNLRAMRYCEVFLIGNGITKNLNANFYNTTDLNNTADPRDTCPEAIWDAVDAGALKKEYKVLGVFKNGPRGWANDWSQAHS